MKTTSTKGTMSESANAKILVVDDDTDGLEVLETRLLGVPSGFVSHTPTSQTLPVAGDGSYHDPIRST